jgi:hypothetical protein
MATLLMMLPDKIPPLLRWWHKAYPTIRHQPEQLLLLLIPPEVLQPLLNAIALLGAETSWKLPLLQC